MDPSLKYTMMSELSDSFNGLAQIKEGHVQVIDPAGVRGFLTDRLVYNAVFHEDPLIKSTSRWMLKEIAQSLHLFPSSTQGIYEAFSKNQKPNFVIPAIRIPGLSFDVACAVFRAAKCLRSGAFIFEISPSEIKETRQTPAEFSAVVMAAGIREEYKGPVFLQAGHFHFDGDFHGHDPDPEMQNMKILIQDAIRSGYFNLRIGGFEEIRQTGLPPTEYQRILIDRIIHLSSFIRRLQPDGTTIAIEGEIGMFPDMDTADILKGFLDQYRAQLDSEEISLNGLCKVSIPLTEGKKPEHSNWKGLGGTNVEKIHHAIRTVKEKYRMACSVAVGNLFPPGKDSDFILKLGVEEIQFSTEFLESYFSQGEIPSEFRQQISPSTIPLIGGHPGPPAFQEEAAPLIHHRSFGFYKEKFWGLPFSVRNRIGFELENAFSTVFEKFNISNTYDWVRKITPEHRIPFSLSHELDACKRYSP